MWWDKLSLSGEASFSLPWFVGGWFSYRCGKRLWRQTSEVMTFYSSSRSWVVDDDDDVNPMMRRKSHLPVAGKTFLRTSSLHRGKRTSTRYPRHKLENIPCKYRATLQPPLNGTKSFLWEINLRNFMDLFRQFSPSLSSQVRIHRKVKISWMKIKSIKLLRRARLLLFHGLSRRCYTFSVNHREDVTKRTWTMRN